jgi:hypothetical protein
MSGKVLRPYDLEQELQARLAAARTARHARSRPQGKFRWFRGRFAIPIMLATSAFAGLGATAVLALFSDSGTVDVQVADKKHSVVDATTTAGAFISYFGDSDTTFGSSGTGTFNPFVRLQGSPTEQGYNTNGTTQFDTKVGTWTHAIKVSEIPQRPCPQVSPTLLCFELFVDINEGNNAKHIALNEVEVWFTTNPNLTGYGATGFSSGADKQYDFSGAILINDVNPGSGRGDLRYDIPINGTNPIALPANCDYGNAACGTYFVLYSQWGTRPSATYNSEGGFEEWKVKVYPIPPTISTQVKLTSDNSNVTAPIPIGTSVYDTATLAKATSDAGGTVTYKLFTDNTCTTLSTTPALNQTVTVTNAIVPNSSSVTFTNAGTFYFQATYNGDANNPGGAQSPCTSETVVVGPNAPAPHSSPVAQIKDTVTVSGLTSNATGTVTVRLFSNNTCTTQVGGDQTFPVSGSTFSAETTFQTVGSGTFYYQVSYDGDSNNTGFTSACTAESVGVSITSLP